jgi:hypothetical protein
MSNAKLCFRHPNCASVMAMEKLHINEIR